MKKTILNAGFIILSVLLTFASCSSDDDNNGNAPVETDASIKLTSSKTKIFPFEDIKVSITTDMELLYENYDSITWKANGVAYGGVLFGNPWVYEDENRDVRITDYRFEENKVYALGYKDGKIISKDSITYLVERPVGDFMDINWNKDKTKNSYRHYTTGMTPNNYLPTDPGWTKTGGVALNFYHIVDDEDGEHVTMQFVPWTSESNWKSKSTKVVTIPDINDFDWDFDYYNDDITPRYEMEYTFHYNYMIELYGEPKYIYEGDDITITSLQEIYNEQFKYRKISGYYPVVIWETPSTVICLLQANNGYKGQNQRGISLIVAEPRK